MTNYIVTLSTEAEHGSCDIIAGTPQHCRQRLRDFIEAGLDEPVLGFLGTAENCLLALNVMREFA